MTFTRLIWPLLLSLLTLLGCASSQEQELPANFHLIYGEPADRVARDIVERRRYLSRLNTSVGDDELRIVLDAPDLLGNMSAVVARRFERDLHEIYGAEEEIEFRVYLLQTEDVTGQQILFVTRAHSISPEGAYSTLPGLIYVFDVAARHVRSVGPADY